MKKVAKEERSREQNKKYKTLIKNDRKRITAVFASENGSNKDLSLLIRSAQSNLDKSVTKKIIHKNNAARKKSALFKMLSSAR